jgi:four helix bundle protein
MPKYERFEDLPVWQEAARLYNRVLDLFEIPNVPISSGFRNQLDRAALSVSNNVAEGFERVTTEQLLAFLSIARGSGAEVRSMMAVVKDRPRLRTVIKNLQEIRSLAESCCRQLSAWATSIEESPIKGKRFATRQTRESQRASQAARNFRMTFLRNLKPEHPLYNSSEAQAARGESSE